MSPNVFKKSEQNRCLVSRKINQRQSLFTFYSNICLAKLWPSPVSIINNKMQIFTVRLFRELAAGASTRNWWMSCSSESVEKKSLAFVWTHTNLVRCTCMHWKNFSCIVLMVANHDLLEFGFSVFCSRKLFTLDTRRPLTFACVCPVYACSCVCVCVCAVWL